MESSRLPIGTTTRYERHRPEATLLYQLVERHYPAFLQELTDRGRSVPAYVEEEFEAYLKCGRLEHGCLRIRCTTCHAERLVAFSCKRRGFCPSCGARRMTESAALLAMRPLESRRGGAKRYHQAGDPVGVGAGERKP